MLMIRLQRVGRKNFPSFRAVLTKKTSGAHGKAMEILGFYNPLTKKGSFKHERIEYWIKQGAGISQTLINLLKKYTSSTDAKNS